MAPNGSERRAIDLADIHVLVVDDHDDTLEVFGAALQRFGANVLKARTARHALAIMNTVRVNAIVSDLTLPGEDGLWLLQQIRRLKSEHGRSVPVIAVTAHWERYAANRLTALGFEAFLTKPVDPVNLARTVASLVGR
jgi:two-component system CheB/CheR fusion protein